VRDHSSVLSLHRLLGVGETVSNRCWIDRVLVILDGIHDEDVFRSDLGQQNRDVCSVTDGSRSNGIQPVYQQPHTIDKLPCAGASGGRGFAKLGEQLAKRGQLHTPISFFQLIPELPGCLQSRDVHTDIGR
jgi:hypothetical protein